MERDKGDILIDYLTIGTIKDYGFETPEAKKLNEKFDFKKYYEKYITKLDDRFVPFDKLYRGAIGTPFPYYHLPSYFRDDLIIYMRDVHFDLIDFIHNRIEPEWTIKENVGYVDDSGEKWQFNVYHSVVDFHRIITKLFKGKELSVDEAVAELKEIVGDEN